MTSIRCVRPAIVLQCWSIARSLLVQLPACGTTPIRGSTNTLLACAVAQRLRRSGRRARMEARANYVAVGAFVLVVLAGILVGCLWLARTQFKTEYQYLETHVAGPVSGLGT